MIELLSSLPRRLNNSQNGFVHVDNDELQSIFVKSCRTFHYVDDEKRRPTGKEQWEKRNQLHFSIVSKINSVIMSLNNFVLLAFAHTFNEYLFLSIHFDSSGHHYYNYFMRKVSLNCQKMNFNFNNCRHHYNYRRWASTIATVIDHDDELLMCVIARRYQKKPFAHNFAYRIVMHSNVLRHLPLVVEESYTVVKIAMRANRRCLI